MSECLFLERVNQFAYLAFHGFGDHALVGVFEGISYRMIVLDMMYMREVDAGNTGGILSRDAHLHILRRWGGYNHSHRFRR